MPESPGTRQDWPHNLTHCCVCDKPFPDPVESWDDYFNEVEEASFACGPCGLAEGYPRDA